MADDVFVAWIGAAVSATGALVAWFRASNIERLKSELAKDAATHAADLRLETERQIELFKLAAAATEEAARSLQNWNDALKDYSAETVTTGGEAWKKSGGALQDLGRAAAKTGLFIPPALDEPFRNAIVALDNATTAVSGASILKGLKYETLESIDKHYRGKEGAEKAVAEFLQKARQWKAMEWPRPRESSGKESGDANG
ncbi:MAG: hypothetical protein U0263_41710 [Polyangiaceae bacterium]